MSDSITLSQAFLRNLKEMNQDAWRRMVEMFSPVVYAWCRKAGLDGHDSADVVQDVFATISRKIDQFQYNTPQASFRAWLATITRTRLADFFRRRSHQALATGGSAAMDWWSAVPDLEHDSKSRSEVQTSLASWTLELIRTEFEPATWQAFWRTAVENQSAKEVAQSLSISVASVYQARCRVLRRLRYRLEELPR
ncbi:MAG: sigma-70 family RNA polymerase sigma factor [Pirellulaceae bacterium]|nr:sigma-70 family RNA polymerase sigma factor [Pirellulaceae bacterium]